MNQPVTVVIANQEGIPSSFNAQSLFINGVHILESDETEATPIYSVATSTASALGVICEYIDIELRPFAEFLAKKNGNHDQFLAGLNDPDADESTVEGYLEGYTNKDLSEYMATVKLSHPAKPLSATLVLKLMDEYEDGPDRYKEFVEQVSSWLNLSVEQINKDLEPYI